MQAEVKVWDIWFDVDFSYDSDTGLDIAEITYDEYQAEMQEGFFRSELKNSAFLYDLRLALYRWMESEAEENYEY